MPPTLPTTENLLTRLAPTETTTIVDQASRTVTFAFSSERKVLRYAWAQDLDVTGGDPSELSNAFYEIIPTKASAWNLERVEQKVCPFLDNHNPNQRLGNITAVEFGNELVTATAKLRSTQACKDLLSDLADDLEPGISFGYLVGKYKVVSPAKYKGEGWDRRLETPATLEATEVILFECSTCPLPADPTIGFNKADEQPISLRGIQIDGDPGWSTVAHRALPKELKEGDWVSWHSARGTGRGRISTIESGGDIKGTSGGTMTGTPTNPAYLVTLWEDSGEDWQPTEKTVCKRAKALTEIPSLKSAGSIQKREEFSLDEAIEEMEEGEELNDLWCAYKELLEDIGDDDTLDDDTRKEHLDQALADFMDKLGTLTESELPANDEPEPRPGYGAAAKDLYNTIRAKIMPPEKTPPTPPTPAPAEGDRTIADLSARLQLEELQQKYNQLQDSFSEEKNYRQLATKCAGMVRRAELLLRAGKLTPAMFKATFGTDDDNPVEIYQAHVKNDPVEFLLKMIEDHGAKIIDFKSTVGSDDLPKHPNERDEEDDTAIQSRAAGILERRKAAGALK